VTPICCDNIDLDAVLTNLPLSRANFPLKYLGLPLTPRRLKRIDFQPLVDKAASKLSAWNGRNLTQAGHVTLVKSVLSSQPIYLLTVLKPTKGTLEDLDKIRRRFLWAGDGNISGGKCKVNWTRTTLPKKLGGLGILDLDKFSRALRLRWLWLQWTTSDKTWAGTEVPCDDTDSLLFANCTQITLGNGKNSSFWGSGWLQGKRPRDIAPLLFAKTMRKNEPSLQLWKITTGCEILTFETDSPRSSSQSSLHCGTLLPQRSSIRIKRTRLDGHKRRTVITPRPQPTKLNSKSSSRRPN
jgi:hypothetical protein